MFEIINHHNSSENNTCAIFDQDGTLSTFTDGWEEILEAIMLKAIFGNNYAEKPANDSIIIQNNVRQLIEMSKGTRTIIQMQTLVEMIKEYNYVSHEDILDPEDYDNTFNCELKNLISERTSLIESDIKVRDEYIIQGTIEFLEILKEKGILLFLVSSTKKDMALQIAISMGYADYFSENIFAPDNNDSGFSKENVIREIINKNCIKSSQVVGFGDGIEDVSAVKSIGGTAVGIVSKNESRLETSKEKQTGLIEAGADVIITDYKCHHNLTEYLFGK
jgi:phosphoglycolate phosphatase-like HAD superfamily hydrolase